ADWALLRNGRQPQLLARLPDLGAGAAQSAARARVRARLAAAAPPLLPESWFQESRVWSRGSKRAGADPGSKIRLELFREPGSVPAKPPGSLGGLSESGVA